LFPLELRQCRVVGQQYGPGGDADLGATEFLHQAGQGARFDDGVSVDQRNVLTAR
jgi:hypothetical protein